MGNSRQTSAENQAQASRLGGKERSASSKVRDITNSYKAVPPGRWQTSGSKPGYLSWRKTGELCASETDVRYDEMSLNRSRSRCKHVNIGAETLSRRQMVEKRRDEVRGSAMFGDLRGVPGSKPCYPASEGMDDGLPSDVCCCCWMVRPSRSLSGIQKQSCLIDDRRHGSNGASRGG